MTSKAKIAYACTACGASFPKWAGKCAECGEWNTLEEAAAARPGERVGYAGESARVLRMEDISVEDQHRFSSGIGELDRVLGGGLVAGSVVLVGGDPGIGKSTILLQALASVSGREAALYVTGEESLQQIAARARRLGVAAADLRLVAETCVESIIATAAREKPRVMVVDSIQTVFTDSIGSAPGGVAQVRESAARLVRYAKQQGVAVLLVGHVTKEGALAGPRVLEHMVDTVLYFEGQQHDRYRLLRSVKNRFGAVNELGVFAMAENGLREVPNPSAIFLSRGEKPVAGSVVMVTWEGTRPLLVEVQALVDGGGGGNPRRLTVGMDHARLAMLLAVLHRHGGIGIADQDVFANVVGGVRVMETGIDLPVLLAVLSSLRNRPLWPDLVVFGEVGLSGELRPVPNGQERLREARKHGFKRAIVPAANAPRKAIDDMTVVGARDLQGVLDAIA